MRVGPIPGTNGLYFAVDVAQSDRGPISATGVDDTLAGARRRCAMELVERQMALDPVDAGVGAGLRFTGTAAAAEAILAERWADFEAAERLACTLWWEGRLPARDLGGSAGQTVSDCLDHWRDKPRTTRAVCLVLQGLCPVVLAVSCGPDGRDVVFGMAAGETEAEAGRAAVRELLQMEFGLHVMRFRRDNGIEWSAREARLEDRARHLHMEDLATLWPRRPPAKAPTLSLRWTRRTENRSGVWLAASTLAAGDLPDPQEGRWRRWALYP